MPVFMTQFSYSAQALTALIRTHQDRAEAIRPLLEQQGGRLIYFFNALGEYDGVTIYEAPDELTAATFVAAAITAGYVKASKTTPLIDATGFISPRW